jgi:hypothetical protein
VDLPAVDPIAEGWTDGTYLIGTDIAPGRYNITSAGTSAYFARLDANLEIIDNNLSEGNVIAVVERLGALVHRRGPGNAMRPLSDWTGVRLPVTAGQDRSSAR